ncbi:MAG: thiamine pyrophosphate-dependent enzyme [Candidatus Gastranaerophilales bacterium]|nr:thiamine pyrophosphate-dependent enzyme [Candidatus Gastranaerophilales bacterium]
MKVADYLIKSLETLGITDFFGLPGDYNFNILYAINDNPNTNWIGCTNELNAGYAADGYARVKGFGAVVTTYGVGELSAINAVAGAFAENVPVINIVGVPKTSDIENKTLIHHNFQAPDYYAFERAFSNVVETTAYLTSKNAKSEIDRVITTFVKERRPVYIAIPIDVTQIEIDGNIGFEYPESNPDNLKSAVEAIVNLADKSKKTVLLADAVLKRYRLEKEFEKLTQQTGYPATNFLMGIGAINTSLKNYPGTYLSDYGNDTAKEILHNTDCLISFGAIYSDLNTFGFALPYDLEDFAAIYGSYTVVNHKRYNDVMMNDILQELIKQLPQKVINLPEIKTGYPELEIKNEKLSSKYIYPRLQEFFKEGDCLFIETGIIPYGFAEIKLPDNVTVNTQTLWGSIGWATPAAFGANAALKDKGRVILFTGEGSHQLTAAEIGNMMHCGFKPVVIVLNNNGYTVERLLSNSPDDNFNNIIQWNYLKLPEVFAGNVWTASAKTDEEFNTVLKMAEQQDCMCYIEIFTEEMDIPSITQKTINKIKELKNTASV